MTTLLRQWTNGDKRVLGRRLIALLFIVLVSFAVRGLTMRFMREHLSDPAWFQSGSYKIFDGQARKILEHKTSVFWIDDPSQTEAAIYPPGYPLWLAFVYKLTDDQSALAIQRIQWLLDSAAVLLIVGIGVTAYNWSIGLVAGMLAALSPLLALSGVTPLADAPTSWIVLSGVWMLMLAFKERNILWTIGAGLAIGLSCWLRPNGLLLVCFWVAALLLQSKIDWRRRLEFSLATVLATMLMVAPLFIRNAFAFRAFVPTGLGTGTNLWEGIGETDRAAEFGAVFGDRVLMEQERREMGVAADAPFSLYFPDGVRRDRERTRKALAVITRHPIWYVGVMARRMAGMLKYAGDPPPYMGSAGINVTSGKTLPAHVSYAPVALAVDGIGMLQSVLRWLLLPLILAGLVLSFRRNKETTIMLLATVLYYLVASSFLHSELRYALPMHALLLVWAGVVVVGLWTSFKWPKDVR